MTRPKLLLADDSVTIRNIVEQTFADEGFDVTTVTNGEDAMWKFTEVQPDVVILDVNMPEPTGYKICEIIKQDETTEHIPVLLVVGSFEPFDQNEAQRVGADGFITKPFHSIRDLIVRVEELIGKPNLAASPAETADIDNLIDRSFSDIPDEVEEQPIQLGLADEVHEPQVETSLAENVDVQPVEMTLADAVNKVDISDEIIKTSYSSRDIGGDDEILIATKVRAGGKLSHLHDAFEKLPLRDDDLVPFHSQVNVEPSEELIALVTKRVVEKLSDHVIREIAKEAVPRIAEKLIREALEQEKKN